MSPLTVEQRIHELESVRSRIRIWRAGSTIAALLFVGICGGVMYTSVTNLFRPGPVQDEYVTNLSTGLQQEVVPNVQKLAVQTLVESRPIAEAQLPKIQAQMPELANASLTEFDNLQTQLPQRAEKVLDASFGKVVQDREAKIRELFPNATDEQIKTFTNNLTEIGHDQLTSLNQQLFSRHIEEMNAITLDIDTISKQEAPNLKGDVPTWQMGLMLFDIARPEITGAAYQASGGGVKPAQTTKAKKTSTIQGY